MSCERKMIESVSPDQERGGRAQLQKNEVVSTDRDIREDLVIGPTGGSVCPIIVREKVHLVTTQVDCVSVV